MISILGGSPHYPHSGYTAEEWEKLRQAFAKLAEELTDDDVPLFRYDVNRIVQFCEKKYKERMEAYGLK